MTNHRNVHIPIDPFRDWCLTELSKEQPFDPPNGRHHAFNGAIARLAERLGTTSRAINRIKRRVRSSSNAMRKGDIPTDTINRTSVEDMLHHAGISFYDVYPAFAHEQDIELEDDAWCRGCAEWTTPICSVCPWCDQPIDDLGMAA